VEMVPLRAGGSRLWRAVRRLRDWSLTIALSVSLLLGGVLGRSSLVTAQPLGPGTDPAFFPATGYRISSPAIFDYFEHHGAVRTFGYPVSSEFPLLGRRVQIFQRHMLEIAPDGTVNAVSVLDPEILPITRIDGLRLPAADPDLLGAAPPSSSPEFLTQALSFVSVYVPDEWNGQPVNFQSTFLSTVSCADAFGTDPCNETLLPGYALEIWGLPTSLPTSDPINGDFVYQRFQKGIMHYSRVTGLTQGLLIGDWLKRIMVGVELSPDIGLEVRGTRFFAQYAPSRPLALDRPAELPDTSLAQAFRADTLTAAGQMMPEPTLPPSVAQTATAVALTATAITGTQAAIQATQVALTATASAGMATPTATPGAAVSDVPVVNVGCLGDEQMWFVPRRPNIGVHVEISVTSRRHHDARAMRLAGPLDSGTVTERLGPLGFVWTWTVVPAVEAFHDWTFFADGLRPCITSGFNAYAPLGATPTPTITPVPSNTPGATSTPTSQPAPNATGFTSAQANPPGGTCGDPIIIVGNDFGAPPSGQQVPTNGRVLFGGRDATIVSWNNSNITIFPPGSTSSGVYTMIVANSGGSSRVPGAYTLTAPGNAC
jgi:IPT/TIG domain